MKPTMNMTKIRMSVSKGFSAVTPWRVGRVLASGALLAAGTALYFNMTSEGQAGSPSSIEKMGVAPKFTDLDAVDNYLSVDDLLNYVYPEEQRAEGMSLDTVGNSTVDRTLSNTELERMDYEADLMLRKAAHQPVVSSPPSKGVTAPSTGRALHDRALLDQLAEANEKAYDELSKSFIGIPYFSEQNKAVSPLFNSRAIELLEEQLSIMLFNAAKAGKPLSSREIDRLQEQIDIMQAAEAQARFGYQSFSSRQNGKRSESLLPDTQYYRDSEWGERQGAK
jgi:hypothetical protein